MSEAGGIVTRFDFPSGALDFPSSWTRGSHLALYNHQLVHRGEAQLEILPLSTIASVRVFFARDARRPGWGISLVIIALFVLALSGPLEQLAAAAAAEMASGGGSGVARALYGLFRVIQAIAGMLPLLALAGVLGGATLGVLGWMGSTTLALTFAGAERTYPARGRNTRLMDFAEALAERVVLAKR
jgi:hypothetical protein